MKIPALNIQLARTRARVCLQFHCQKLVGQGYLDSFSTFSSGKPLASSQEWSLYRWVLRNRGKVSFHTLITGWADKVREDYRQCLWDTSEAKVGHWGKQL